MAEIESRDYQDQSVARTLAASGRIIECSPTGSGKTIIQARVCKEGLDAGERTAILTPRAEIFDQTHGKLMTECGAHNVATLRAGYDWDSYKKVHVVSWPTLINRMGKDLAWLPQVDRVLVDEVHLAMAPGIHRILEYYANKVPVIGFSATPARKTGKGLGHYFQEINIVTTVRELIQRGYLCPHEYWGGRLPDLAGIKTQAGDYVTAKLSERCAILVGDVVDNWLRLASDRQTIVFAVDIAHAEALTDRFLTIGISSACIHNKLQPEARKDIVTGFKSGRIQVLINVTIASYGFDSPQVSCIVAARPTKSLVLWLQMLGRGSRVHPGKDACMVLDHADNTRTLGHAEDEYSWDLDNKKAGVKNRTKEAGEQKPAAQDNTCGKCSYMFSGSRVCPRCGWEKPFTAKDVATVDADLVRIGKALVKPLGEGWPSHEMFYRMLRHHAARLGKDSKWAWHAYHEKVGVGPLRDWADLAHVPPVPRIKNWITARNIRYVKGRAKLDRQRDDSNGSGQGAAG